MGEGDLQAAIEAAEKLAEESTTGGLQVAFDALEREVVAFEANGYPLESIVPTGSDQGLGFALRGKDGAGFFAVYSRLLKDKLCAEGGEFNTLIKNGIQASVGSILTLIVAATGVPAIALGVLVPIAVVIAHTGLEAFCAMQEAPT